MIQFYMVMMGVLRILLPMVLVGFFNSTPLLILISFISVFVNVKVLNGNPAYTSCYTGRLKVRNVQMFCGSVSFDYELTCKGKLYLLLGLLNPYDDYRNTHLRFVPSFADGEVMYLSRRMTGAEEKVGFWFTHPIDHEPDDAVANEMFHFETGIRWVVSSKGMFDLSGKVKDTTKYFNAEEFDT